MARDAGLLRVGAGAVLGPWRAMPERWCTGVVMGPVVCWCRAAALSAVHHFWGGCTPAL